jgi:hypothetical protein
MQDTHQSIEIPQESNSLELLCLTDSGVWLPAMVMRIDSSVIDGSLYVKPLRFRLRFATYDYSKARYSDRISGEPGTYSSEGENCFQRAP